jgi:hypothetical protein
MHASTPACVAAITFSVLVSGVTMMNGVSARAESARTFCSNS